MIPVTKTFIPHIEDYTAVLQRAFKNGWLTNRGELVVELENKISTYLSLEESAVLCTSNGTVPLHIALKVLGNGGEIITTPFSYVASTSVIVWESCTPVFVDIHPDYFTIDETKIEAAITSKTTAILATHVFGNPCNVEEIQRIAKKHNLKVIYDAAHCFGVKYKGKSIFEYGDVCTCSFHATKLFHTGEGGALFCKDKLLFKKLYDHHNFGHDGIENIQGLGTNGKMSELQGAMGLTVLEHIDEILLSRKEIVEKYNQLLADSAIKKIQLRSETDWNFHYYPIIFKNDDQLLKVQKALNEKQIFPRRYFYPSLNKLDYVGKSEMPIAERISSCILCLPLYHSLKNDDINQIVKITLKWL